MAPWSRARRKSLVDLLDRRVEGAPTDGPDWIVGLTVACEVQDLESALQRAGLADGVEPSRS